MKTSPIVTGLLCAWVIWQELLMSSGGPAEWLIRGAHPSFEVCEKGRKSLVATGAGWGPDRPGRKIEREGNTVLVEITKADGGLTLWAYRFLCLPDTVDPRSRAKE